MRAFETSLYARRFCALKHNYRLALGDRVLRQIAARKAVVLEVFSKRLWYVSTCRQAWLGGPMEECFVPQ